MKTTEAGATAWLKVAAGVDRNGTPVARFAGVVEETTGGTGAAAVVNVQL